MISCMKDEDKTKEQLIAELVEMRSRFALPGGSEDAAPGWKPQDAFEQNRDLAREVAERTVELVSTDVKLGEEIEERQAAEKDLKAGNTLLELVSGASSRKEYLDGVVRLLREWSGCCCVGIRVVDPAGSIPYESHVGFSRDFWERENWLLLDKDSCACVRVIKGEFEPQDACCTTLGGSFRLGDSAEFVHTLSGDELKRFRGECIKIGFRSIAVIPLRYEGTTLGAIHMADAEPFIFTDRLIGFIERMTPLIGEGLYKFNMRDSLDRHCGMLEQVNRALRVLSESNYALAQERDEGKLLDRVCRAIVELGGYRLAWVGYAEQDAEKSVKVVAQAGDEEGYLDSIRITWADTEQGRGPTGTALREGEIRLARSIGSDPDYGPWRKEAMKQGYASSVALPLKAAGRTFAALNIYAVEPEAFDGEVLRFLKTLADNLTYGIVAIRTQQAKRRAEEALEEQRLLLEAVLSQAADGIIAINVDGQFIFVNNAARSMMALPDPDEGMPALAEDIWGEARTQTGARIPVEKWALQKALEGTVTVGGESRMVRPDGSIYDVSVSASPLRKTDGAIMGAVAILSDITQRRQTEQVVREQAALLDLAYDAILVRDREGKVAYWNRGAEETYGFSKKRALGSSIEELLQAQYPEPIDVMLGKVFQDGKWDGELRHVKIDGSPITVASRWALQRNSKGEPTGILEINRDITKHKEVEEALKAYALKLESLNEDLQEFAFVASHDLQEPLRKIRSFGETLNSKYKESLDESGRDYLHRMTAAAARMQDLLEGLLSYSRVTTRAAQFKPVDLNQAIRDAVSDLEIAVTGAEGQIEFEGLPVLEADEPQMRQLFQNLIGNALKYRQAGQKPLIKIHSRMEGDACLIFVEDNGIGFEEEYLERIFKPFQRLHGRSSAYSGSGMGLAICRKIVERHGGSITAMSAPGKGSTFIVSLPAKLRDRR